MQAPTTMGRSATAKSALDAAPLTLSPDRFFDSDAAIRRAARAVYESTNGLPLVCPHGHVDPGILAENTAFADPTSLLITPDHYILRLLYAQGIPMESMGVPRLDGSPVESDPRVIWQRFADHYYLFRGTPTGAWLDHELHELFGVRVKLVGETARHVYDQIAECLASPEFRPRALFDRFNIEVLATTDAASDGLEHHAAIRSSGWKGRVIPTFRPDAAFKIAGPSWKQEIAALERRTGVAIDSYAAFIDCLERRRLEFKRAGATATDHAAAEPYTTLLSAKELDRVFGLAMNGTATAGDERQFLGHMLVEMARMSTEDGLVMQLHPGASRDHNGQIAARFGPDKGGDIPLATEFTRNLQPLLERHGNDRRLTLVLFTLDESTYARELAPLAGHYPAVRLGPPWWFNDSIEGMTRFRQQTTETAGIYRTSGFNDDTRAFCSIPARHDLARRVDANFLAGLVARHVIDLADAHEMARAMAYDLARETYRLGEARR